MALALWLVDVRDWRVYGVVALIVKMDDVGLHLAEKPSKGSQRLGLALVSAKPKLLAAISFIGTLAMLWVGGHILLVGTHDLGWDLLYDAVHHLEEAAHDAAGAAQQAAPTKIAWSCSMPASSSSGRYWRRAMFSARLMM